MYLLLAVNGKFCGGNNIIVTTEQLTLSCNSSGEGDLVCYGDHITLTTLPEEGGQVRSCM